MPTLQFLLWRPEKIVARSKSIMVEIEDHKRDEHYRFVDSKWFVKLVLQKSMSDLATRTTADIGRNMVIASDYSFDLSLGLLGI